MTHNKLGDIIAGCEDKSFKIFTKDVNRQATGKDFEEFENEVKSNAQSQGQQFDLAKLKEFRTEVENKLVGSKDNDVQVFKDQGVAKAYMWKGDQHKWECLGEVMSGPQGGDNMSAA